MTKLAKYPSYTADLWKSRTKDYFVAVTLHWIDDSWELHSPTIAMPHILGRHTGNNVGECVAKALQPFLGDGVHPFSAVLDGGDIASVVKTSEYEILHVCFLLPCKVLRLYYRTTTMYLPHAQ